MSQPLTSQMKITNQYTMSCPRRAEFPLAAELEGMGITKPRTYSGGVSFQTTSENALTALLQSRIADRIYKVLFKFKIKNEDDLYKKSLLLPWEEVMELSDTFKISTLLDREASKTFNNSMFLSYKLKDAIADHFMKKHKKRPDVHTDDPDCPLRLHVEKTPRRGEFFATISLDLSGIPLSQRGYRKDSNTAPLRENLAAALILSTDWDPQSGERFIDPMCGSGTIIIEAALFKLGVSPSYLKLRGLIKSKEEAWCFLQQKWFKKDSTLKAWFKRESEKIYNSNEAALESAEQLNIYGSDLAQENIKLCNMNLRKAAVFKCVEIKQMNALQLSHEHNIPGVILTNPPYGERMGDLEELKDLYFQFGEHLKKNFKQTRVYIFTGTPELRKSISLQTSRRIEFFNGPIECRLLRYELF